MNQEQLLSWMMDCLHQDPAYHFSQDQFLQIQNHIHVLIEQSEIYCAKDAETIYSCLLFDAQNNQIVWVYTDSKYRKQGYGKMAFEQLLDHAKATGSKIQAKTNLDDVAAFYAHLGFQLSQHDQQNRIYEYFLYTEYLGQMVHVEVEHTLGEFHPYYSDMQYPLNVGFVKEIFQQWQFYQDAILLDETHPIDKGDGVVVGIVYQLDENKSYFLIQHAIHQIDQNEIISKVGPLLENTKTYFIWNTK